MKNELSARLKLRDVLSKYQSRITAIPALMGDGCGNVDGDQPNEVIVRIGGDITTCLNIRAPKQDNMPIWIGYDPLMPYTPQVIGTNWSFVDDTSGIVSNVPNHGWEHEFFGRDPSDVYTMQIIDFRVLPYPDSGNWFVNMDGGIVVLNGVPTYIVSELFDLRSYVPTTLTKVKLLLMTIDNAGDVVFTATADLTPPATLANSPAIPTNTAFTIALIRLDPTLGKIIIAREGRDIIDLRWLAGNHQSMTPTAHATTHQNGGTDEINVGGLSGLLADQQTPLAHKASHENGGNDEISVAGLSGELSDPQPPKSHQHTEDDLDLSDVTTGDATIARHGFQSKLSGNSTDVWHGDGTWAHVDEHIHVYNENLSSQADGATTQFTVVNYYQSGTLQVWVNGLLQLAGTDYTEDEDLLHFTFTTAPEEDDVVVIAYIFTAIGDPNVYFTDSYANQLTDSRGNLIFQPISTAVILTDGAGVELVDGVGQALTNDPVELVDNDIDNLVDDDGEILVGDNA